MTGQLRWLRVPYREAMATRPAGRITGNARAAGSPLPETPAGASPARAKK
jgi:hypothetical protein